MPHVIVYTSSATRPMMESDLVKLMASSRANNERHGLTGMLLYRDGTFMQVLEGDREVVQGLFGRIRQDPRHRDVKVIADEGRAIRGFQDWSMSFQSGFNLAVHSLPGFNPYLDRPSSVSLPPGRMAERPAVA